MADAANVHPLPTDSRACPFGACDGSGWILGPEDVARPCECRERLTSVDLLHVDDLGAEKRSDWVLEQLYAMVNERYEAERSMVVTTNLDQAALEEQIGMRTVSRLVEICGDPLPLFGQDLRYRVG